MKVRMILLTHLLKEQHKLSNSLGVALLQVGPEEHVICALSGGVDSTVAATLVHRVVGDRLHCVFVDNGLLRFKVGLDPASFQALPPCPS